jgi:quercetin dioxygenase-like cupin family protein
MDISSELDSTPNTRAAPLPPNAAVQSLVRGGRAELVSFPDGSEMHLLGEQLGASTTFTAHRTTLRAGRIGANPHHHVRTTELIYVVAGAVELLVGQRLFEARAGDLAVIAPGVSHAFAALTGDDAEILDLVTPAVARFELFREIARVAHGAQPSFDLADQTQFDTYADDSAHWAVARQDKRNDHE